MRRVLESQVAPNQRHAHGAGDHLRYSLAACADQIGDGQIFSFLPEVLFTEQLWVNPNADSRRADGPKLRRQIGSTACWWYDIMSDGLLDPSRCPLLAKNNAAW